MSGPEVPSELEPGAGPDADEAARTALGRARAAASARGQTPGRRPKAARTADRSRASAAGPDARDPQLVASTLDRLVAEHGWRAPVAVGGVIGRWREVVGADIAAHCEPQEFTDGVLVVRADSTAWATQVRLLAPTLIRRLAEEVGDGVVTRVQVRGPGSPSWRRGRRAVRGGRGPRDTYG